MIKKKDTYISTFKITLHFIILNVFLSEDFFLFLNHWFY